MERRTEIKAQRSPFRRMQVKWLCPEHSEKQSQG
jgi:hypothetical protein